MRRVTLTNVKRHLEWIQTSVEGMLERDGKHEGGLRLAPIDKENLREIKLLNAAILRKHAAKQTRKDVYVNRK